MMNIDYLHNKRILVAGLGATGASVVRFLHANNIMFDVVDEHAKPSATLADCITGATVYETLSVELCCGYDVLILSPGIPRAHNAVSQAINAGVQVIGDIELFAHAINDTPVIAVTGSNGKSTVVSWIAHVLAGCGKHAVLCGNIGLPALDAIDARAEIYVLELSSYQLESTRSLRALSATVLNISDDHMDRYDSIDHYASTKRIIYTSCHHAVVNHDDERTWVTPSALKAGATHTSFSTMSGDADYCLDAAANDAWLTHRATHVVKSGELKVPGNHNIANALAVLALLEPLMLDSTAVVSALITFSGLEHRTEFVRERRGVRWFNDSKGTNIDACKNAIEAMQAPVILIAGGLGKGANFSTLRTAVQAHVKLLVLIGEDATLIATMLEGTATVVMAESLIDAVARCAEAAESGDAVLLSPACASFDMFDNFEHRGVAFKQAVEALAA